jgi:superfamily II DNA or RNA helicase
MNSKIKYKIRKATISDKIYFNKQDILDIPFHDFRYVLFNYNLGDTFFSTLEYDEETGMCSVPSGSWHKLDILELEDLRANTDVQEWAFKGKLKTEQQSVADKLLQNNKLYSGLVKADCGWGKTYLGTYLIGTYKKPTIIICHTKLLAYQWLDSIKELIDVEEVGFIGDGKESIKPITIAIYKSLLTRLDKVMDQFEVLFVDEAHLCPAETFSRAVNGVNARVKIALSATPIRKDGLHIILPDFFGPNRIIAENVDKLSATVQVIQTDIPFRVINPNRDWTRQLTKLAKNSSYLDLIAKTARDKISHGRCPLIVSERIEMLEELQSRIPGSVLLVGSTKNAQREDILKNAGTKYSAILSTKIFDEGISCHRLDTLMFTCPGNNYAKLEQRIGRILRKHPDKKDPLIIDFWLTGPIVYNQQKGRLEWYRKQNYETIEN